MAFHSLEWGKVSCGWLCDRLAAITTIHLDVGEQIFCCRWAQKLYKSAVHIWLWSPSCGGLETCLTQWLISSWSITCSQSTKKALWCTADCSAGGTRWRMCHCPVERGNQKGRAVDAVDAKIPCFYSLYGAKLNPKDMKLLTLSKHSPWFDHQSCVWHDSNVYIPNFVKNITGFWI